MDRARGGRPAFGQTRDDHEDGSPVSPCRYHAQQCAEKCLKAYLVAGMTDFPYTHNIGALLELCAPTAAWVPEVQGAEALSTYAVTARYPGGPDRVSKREAVVAIEHAARVLKTVTGDLKRKNFL